MRRFTKLSLSLFLIAVAISAQSVTVELDSIKDYYTGDAVDYPEYCKIYNNSDDTILTDSIEIVSISPATLTDGSPLTVEDIYLECSIANDFWKKKSGIIN